MPHQIVIDPFGGSGTTIDLCKKRHRRYWVSDRLPIPEREKEIRKADILDGPPPLHKRWSEVALLYLDPPYWKQAEGAYSKDEQDLANMPLDKFYESIAGYITGCASKMPANSTIALIIQPTQWKNENREVADHVIDLIQTVKTKYVKYSYRISCPYESQQCTPQMVEWAKKHNQPLVLTREIIIWRRI
jgi:DNA modification methylase